MATSVKIEASKEIFNEWGKLSDKIKELSVIVQFDGEITEKKMVDWLDKSRRLQSEFNKLHDVVFNYVVRGDKDALRR